MNIIGVIPARMGSSRFPGKPLAKICGQPMIEHVFKRSAMARALTDVYIATCDEEISEAAKNFGAKVIMTKSSHERASDRVAEAMLKIEEDLHRRVDVLVMIQGDEPMVTPQMIDEAIHPLTVDAHIEVANLMAPIRTRVEQDSRNTIKVVCDKNGFALYFSREPIPTRVKTKGELLMHKQVCVIPFRRDFLLTFNNLEPTPLEIAESVDMMRVLEHGYKVKMILTEHETYSVDMEEDLNKVEKYMLRDKLFIKYCHEKFQ